MVDWSVFEKKEKQYGKEREQQRECGPTPVGIAKNPRSVFLSGLKSIQRPSVCERGDGF